MKKISDNVYVETEYEGCNVGFITDKAGIVMIDTPMSPKDAVDWRDKIAEYGPVRYLINTEPHGDHFSGNFFFDGTVIGHEGTREAILNSSVGQHKGMLQQMGMDPDTLDKDFHFRAPEITLSQRLNIYFGDHTFRLINMPGHTPYQVAVFIPEEKVVFTSDNIFHETIPFMQQALPFSWLDSLKELEQLDVDFMVPGHGHICDRSYLQKMSANIQSWIDAVTQTIEKGLNTEQAMEEISMFEMYPSDDKEHVLNIQRMNITRLYEVLK